MSTLNLRKETIRVGAETPFRILHTSDTHLCFVNEADNERKHRLAAGRIQYFDPESFHVLQKMLDFAKSENMMTVHTGDLIDFVSCGNVAAAKELTGRYDIFFADGNHEFSQYVGEAFEDEAYLQQSYDFVQSAFPENIRFSSRIVNGVNFVAMDDVYYHFRKEDFEALKKEEEKGLPIILCMHNPIYTPALYERAMEHNEIAYLTGVPAELIKHYPEDRYIQQCPTGFDLTVCDHLLKSPVIRAFLFGHIHYAYREDLPDGKTILCCGVCTDGCEVTIE